MFSPSSQVIFLTPISHENVTVIKWRQNPKQTPFKNNNEIAIILKIKTFYLKNVK